MQRMYTGICRTGYTSVGHTNAFRVLVLVWTMRGDATRPITAFDASERLTKRYLIEKGI